MNLYLVGHDSLLYISANSPTEAALKYVEKKMELGEPLSLIVKVCDGSKNWFVWTEAMIVEVTKKHVHEWADSLMRRIVEDDSR